MLGRRDAAAEPVAEKPRRPSLASVHFLNTCRGLCPGVLWAACTACGGKCTGRSVVTDIAAEVRDILVFHLGSEEATLTDNAKLIEDLGADSLDVVEVVMSFEEKFNIDIPNDMATKFVTVGDAIAFIKAHPSLWPTVGSPRPEVRATF